MEIAGHVSIAKVFVTGTAELLNIRGIRALSILTVNYSNPELLQSRNSVSQ